MVIKVFLLKTELKCALLIVDIGTFYPLVSGVGAAAGLCRKNDNLPLQEAAAETTGLLCSVLH